MTRGLCSSKDALQFPKFKVWKMWFLKRLMILLSPYTLEVQRCTRISKQCIGGLAWNEIAQYVSECDVYQRVKAVHQKSVGLLQPLKIPEWKWDMIEMDFVTGFPKSRRGNDAIFVVIDRLSKVTHFFPVKESIPASQLAKLYTTRIVPLHGIPLEICQTVELISGRAFKKPLVPSFSSAQPIILSLKAKLKELIRSWRICSGHVVSHLAWNGKNAFHMLNSPTKTTTRQA